MMKKVFALVLTLFLLSAATCSAAFVMNGQGACKRCGCSGFHAKTQGFQNQCNCGHWQNDHSR